MSASRDAVDIKDLLRDKKFLLIIAIVLLIALSIGGYFLFFNNANSAPDAVTLPAPGAAPGAPGIVGASGTKVAAGVPAASGAPGVPVGASSAPSGAPGMPGTSSASVGSVASVPVGPAAAKRTGANGTAVASVVPKDSFYGAPPGYGSGQASAASALGASGLGGQMQGNLGETGATSGSFGGGATSSTSKPAPIKPNVRAMAARLDPFVPFYKFIIMQPPAYTFLSDQRLAARPTPTPIPQIIDPNIRFGPLPAVERRVAGILFDGSVSAIMETGTPGGASTEVDVIQPGSTVPSGAPNIEPLTVASITPTQVVLRAQDGRTAVVKLSNVSAEYADAFHSATNGPGLGGGEGPSGPGGLPQGGQGGKPQGRGNSGPSRAGI